MFRRPREYKHIAPTEFFSTTLKIQINKGLRTQNLRLLRKYSKSLLQHLFFATKNRLFREEEQILATIDLVSEEIELLEGKYKEYILFCLAISVKYKRSDDAK